MPRRPRSAQSPARRRPWRLERLEDRAVPAVAVWDGGGGTDGRWTTPANWVGDVAPTAGSDLTFPAGAAQLNSVNDFPAGTAFGTVTITAGYVISGNAVTPGQVNVS